MVLRAWLRVSLGCYRHCRAVVGLCAPPVCSWVCRVQTRWYDRMPLLLASRSNSSRVRLVAAAHAACGGGKTKAQGVGSEPRSPTKSPRALGSSKEHSMRMGGIPSLPL